MLAYFGGIGAPQKGAGYMPIAKKSYGTMEESFLVRAVGRKLVKVFSA